MPNSSVCSELKYPLLFLGFPSIIMVSANYQGSLSHSQNQLRINFGLQQESDPATLEAEHTSDKYH